MPWTEPPAPTAESIRLRDLREKRERIEGQLQNERRLLAGYIDLQRKWRALGRGVMADCEQANINRIKAKIVDLDRNRINILFEERGFTDGNTSAD
jgi:hypothetical protein